MPESWFILFMLHEVIHAMLVVRLGLLMKFAYLQPGQSAAASTRLFTVGFPVGCVPLLLAVEV